MVLDKRTCERIDEVWDRLELALIDGINIGIPDEDFGREVIPGWKQKIAGYSSIENNSVDYVYDFDDYWVHKIRLETILPRQENISYPICIKGKRACPPEDCGGTWGYEELLEIIRTPDHEKYEEILEWIGEEFDAEHFDVREVSLTYPDEHHKNLFW